MWPFFASGLANQRHAKFAGHDHVHINDAYLIAPHNGVALPGMGKIDPNLP
jgi:hypothetical protein